MIYMSMRSKQVVTTAVLVPFFFIMAAVVGGAQTPNIGGAVEQATPPPKEAPAKAKLPQIEVMGDDAEFSLEDGATLLVKDFKIEGAEAGDAEKLSALLASSRGRELTMGQITEAANHLTLFYRDRGYMVAKAYLPKQDASSGVLTIRMILGSYGEITLKNESAIRDSLLQGVFDRVRSDSPVIRRKGMERAMMLVSEMPGGSMPTMAITPGAAEGTSDVQVGVPGAPRLTGYAMSNNQGSRYTGEYRVYGGVDVNTPFGVGDRLSVTYMTTDTTDLHSFRAAYEFPLSVNGLRGEVSAARTTYELGGIYSDLGATGAATIVEGLIKYPVVKLRGETIDFSAKLAHKRMSDDIGAVDMENPRNATVLTLSLGREAFKDLSGHMLYTQLSGGFDIGSLNITDADQKDLDAAGANTDGAFSKFNLDAAATLGLVGKLSIRGSMKFQKVVTGNNVDSTEQFFVSGSGGVKAYSESVGFDNGYLFGAELRQGLPNFGQVRHSVGFFVDTGRTWAQKGAYALIDEYTLTDTGPSYSINVWKFFGGVQVAIPVGTVRGIGDPGTRALFQAGLAF